METSFQANANRLSWRSGGALSAGPQNLPFHGGNTGSIPVGRANYLAVQWRVGLRFISNSSPTDGCSSRTYIAGDIAQMSIFRFSVCGGIKLKRKLRRAPGHVISWWPEQTPER